MGNKRNIKIFHSRNLSRFSETGGTCPERRNANMIELD